jgi:hypothetical protein
MRGLLEGRGWKSTQEFAQPTGSDLKQGCTCLVPNQNETKSKTLPESNSVRGSKAKLVY